MENPLTARGWPLPHISNKLSEDQPRLVATLEAIDSDITALEGLAAALGTGVTTNTASITAQGGQIASLNAKTASNDNTLDTLQKAADRIKAAESSVAGKSAQADLQAAVPPGVMWPFAGATAPAGFLMCYGQAVSRATYAALFSAIGTAHGAGDGSSTFNLPDMRGRVPAGVGNMGGTSISLMTRNKGNCVVTSGSAVVTGMANTGNISVGMRASATGYFPDGTTVLSIDSATQVTLSAPATASGNPVAIRFGQVMEDTLGDKGGSTTVTLTSGQMPAHSHTGSTSAAGAHSHTGSTDTAGAHTHSGGATTGANGGTIESGSYPFVSTTGSAGAHSHSVTTSAAADHSHTVTINNTGAGEAAPNIQPTIMVNYIIKT